MPHERFSSVNVDITGLNNADKVRNLTGVEQIAIFELAIIGSVVGSVAVSRVAAGILARRISKNVESELEVKEKKAVGKV